MLVEPYASNSDAAAIDKRYQLSEPEMNWSRIQEPLAERGYMLRPRYRPGWVPSWIGTTKRPELCEDSIVLGGPQILLDATRISDGLQVLLKLWISSARDGPELLGLEYFSEPSRAMNPANHCIQLLDSFPIEGWDHRFEKVLVEPLLRDFREPSFVMVAEALSFVLQTLEGLEYMHSQNVTHGDIHSGNILMEARGMFPDGFHGAFNLNPFHRLSERGLRRRSRLRAPPKYFFIDFGSCNIFPSFEEREPVQAIATAWIPPEIRHDPTTYYDPFKGDVYALGMTLMSEMRYRPGMRFLFPLLISMVGNDPDSRPTVAEVRRSVLKHVSTMTPGQLRRRIGWMHPAGRRVSLRFQVWDTWQYLKLLWDSYWYGLPKDILEAAQSSQA